MQRSEKNGEGLIKQLKGFKNSYKFNSLKISLIYLVIGLLWIYLSDELFFRLIQDKELLLIAAAYKGMAFVTATTVLLYLSIGHQLKKLENSRKQILDLSYYDALSGLFNRRYYDEQIKNLDVEMNLPISIIMADIDGLKLVNDAFGHQIGDELIKKAADALRNSCRGSDLIARWGGDEFVILLPNTKDEEVAKIAQRIKEACKQEQVEQIDVSMSIGWDTKNEQIQNIFETLKNAEDHMYYNKVRQSDSIRDDMMKKILQAIHDKKPNASA